MAVCNKALNVERNLDACYEIDVNWDLFPKRLEKVTNCLHI